MEYRTSVAEESAARTGSHPKIRLFLADDNKDLCEVLKHYFDALDDFTVVQVAYTGTDVLAVLPTVETDVLLLDLIMPHLDGLGVLEKLPGLGLEHKPVVVVLSAFGHETITRHAMELGADYFILKPFTLDVLAERLREVVSRLRRPLPNPAGVRRRATATADLEVEITERLQEIAIPAHVKGYMYLREAIAMTVLNPALLAAITKELYPAVASRYGTTPSRVERAIRHAIEVTWGRARPEVLSAVFGYTVNLERGKPSNAEFIALMADRVRLRLPHGQR